MFHVYDHARRVDVGAVTLSVVDYGPSDGAPVVLLHGFPDSARLWRHQIPVLARAGYRTITPDLRGFGRSDRPSGVDQYGMRDALGDVMGLLSAMEVERADFVAHDWGAAVAWRLAIHVPQVVNTLVAVSVGHPAAWDQSIDQLRKTWYMLLFQFEGIAEDLLARDDWSLLRRWTSDATDIEAWIADLERPGALTAALSWYRANVPPERLLDAGADDPVACDVMGVWSTGDLALNERGVTDSERLVSGRWRYERIEGASHWIPVDAADELNGLLLDWFSGR